VFSPEFLVYKPRIANRDSAGGDGIDLFSPRVLQRLI
jgi:hypothetical protein